MEDFQRRKFEVPGRYVATFHYTTTNGDANSWISCFGPETCNREWLRPLLQRVPAVDLTARTTFEVAP